MPEGTVVCNLEEKTGDRGRMARTSGNYATVISHNLETRRTRVKLPSGTKKVIPSSNRAMVGKWPFHCHTESIYSHRYFMCQFCFEGREIIRTAVTILCHWFTTVLHDLTLTHYVLYYLARLTVPPVLRSHRWAYCTPPWGWGSLYRVPTVRESHGKQRGSGKSQGILKYHSLDQLFMHYFHNFCRLLGASPLDPHRGSTPNTAG